MKNIHLLPTDKLSRLYIDNRGKYNLEIGQVDFITFQNIYITSNEEIKEGVDQWYLDKVLNEPYNSGGAQYSSKQDVIILTTDQDLIKDGVQAIDDEFLEWFVKNPSCEEIQVDKFISGRYFVTNPIITKEEPKERLKKVLGLKHPKQECKGSFKDCFKPLDECVCDTMKNKETLEESYNKIHKEIDFSEFDFASFAIGVKFQQERSYSEEEVLDILFKHTEYFNGYGKRMTLTEWFNNLKKK
jgi:hypothetical protein